MAIDTKIYINKIKPNLWADKDFKVFYYNFKTGTKKNRGLIDVSNRAGWNKRDRVSFAEAELLKIKNKKQSNIDDRVILDKFMEKHFSLLPDTKWTKEKKDFYENHISKEIGKKYMKDITGFHVKEVKKIVLNKKRVLKDGTEQEISERTADRVYEVLKPAFKEAFENRIIEFDPVATLTVKRSSTKKIVSNATKELKEIYEAIVDVFADDPYYQAFFLFGVQGRRKDEIFSLLKDDVVYEYNYYVLRNTKNDEEQKMFLPENIKYLLLKIKDLDGIYMFSSPITGEKLQDVRRQVNKLKKKLGNPKFSLHYLRNVVTSVMGEQGIDSVYQSGALGHNDLNTINQYATIPYLIGSEMASRAIEVAVNQRS